MRSSDRRRSTGTLRPAAGLVAWLALLATATATTAHAWEPYESDPQLRAQKVEWQKRYRSLLERQASLREEIAREQELYADANRRNYRRGRKRHVHRDAMLAAKDKLAAVEAELDGFEDEARRAGALPGWLYEVEAEMEDADRRPAIATGPGDDGRNPLYVDEDEGSDEDR